MRNNIISENVSFEEFERLANRQPNLEGTWIYRLEMTELPDPEDISYQEYELGMTHELYFKSLSDAEAYMRTHIDDAQLYHSIITQVPLGAPSYNIGAQWLYDCQGNLLDFTITTQTGSAEATHFFGRPSERQRFKEGEIVEVVWRDRVNLGLLLHTSPSVERCWNLYQRCLNDKSDKLPYCLDASDDSCYVLEGPDYGSHSHPSPIYLMTPRFPISPELEAEIKSWHRKAEDTAKAVKTMK